MEGTTLKKLSALPQTLTVLRLFNSMGEVIEPQLERNMQQEEL